MEQYPGLLHAEFRIQEKKKTYGKYSKAGTVDMLSELKSIKNPLHRLEVYERALMSDM